MTLPPFFRNERERVIASFDAFDIASGTGIKNFYAGDTVDTTILSDQTFYSDTIVSNTGNIGISADAKRLDIDYDVEINNPLTIVGKTVLNVPISATRTGGTTTAHVVAVLRKESASVETDIVTNISRVLSVSLGTGYTMLAIDLDIPQTSFKRGDILRLTVELWASGGASPASAAFAHDPKGRTTGWDVSGAVPSTLIMQLPIKIQL